MERRNAVEWDRDPGVLARRADGLHGPGAGNRQTASTPGTTTDF